MSFASEKRVRDSYTKTNNLDANTTPLSTDVALLVDNPAGPPASQKITLANLMALFANPVTDDGDTLGTAALRWSDLFLAEGGVIDWDNGDATLAQAGNIISAGGITNFNPATNDLAALGSATVSWADAFLAAGGEINWANGQIRLRDGLSSNLQFAAGFLETLAGTTTQPSLLMPAGTLMTTPSDGALEMDATNFYATTDAGNRGYVSAHHYTRQVANRTLPNDTNENPIFDSTRDRLTIEAGVYRFESILRVTAMSGTSGNALIDWLGAGTATIDTWLWWYEALDNSSPSPGPIAPTSIGWPAQQDSAASIAVAGTGTALAVVARGTFDCTTGGTLIPSIDLVTAAAASVTAGSYFMCERMGPTDATSVGQWD